MVRTWQTHYFYRKQETKGSIINKNTDFLQVKLHGSIQRQELLQKLFLIFSEKVEWAAKYFDLKM